MTTDRPYFVRTAKTWDGSKGDLTFQYTPPSKLKNDPTASTSDVQHRLDAYVDGEHAGHMLLNDGDKTYPHGLIDYVSTTGMPNQGIGRALGENFRDQIGIQPIHDGTMQSGKGIGFAAATPEWPSFNGRRVTPSVKPKQPDPAEQMSLFGKRAFFARTAARPQTGEWGTFWHGTPSGSLQGAAYGLHVGTQEAARQALEARIGKRADGKDWDGTQEYGKTLLAGHNTLLQMGGYPTGVNSGAGWDDYYPPATGGAVFSDGSPVLPTHKPDLMPLKITGPMNNTPQTPHQDFRANGYMKAAITKGVARNGYFYTNEGEDAGSVSAVVPGEAHVQKLPRTTTAFFVRTAAFEIEGAIDMNRNQPMQVPGASFDPNNFYRQIGEGGYNDFLQTGVVKPAEGGKRSYDRAYYNQGAPLARYQGQGANYFVETPPHPAMQQMPGIYPHTQPGEHLTSADPMKIYKHDPATNQLTVLHDTMSQQQKVAFFVREAVQSPAGVDFEGARQRSLSLDQNYHHYQNFMATDEDSPEINAALDAHPEYEKYDVDIPDEAHNANQDYASNVAVGHWSAFQDARDIRKAGWGIIGKPMPSAAQAISTPDPHLNYQEPQRGKLSEEPDPQGAAVSAYSLMRGIHNAPSTSPALYRGVGMVDANKFASQVKPGHTFDMPLAAFASTQQHSKQFGSDLNFQLEPGAKSVIGGEMGQMGSGSNEHITGGKFQVTHVTPHPTRPNSYTVGLKHLGSFDPDAPRQTQANTEFDMRPFDHLFDGSLREKVQRTAFFVRQGATQMMNPADLWGHTRDLSLPHHQQKINDLADSIKQNGYNLDWTDDRPIHVSQEPDNSWRISDGNHRLKAMEQAGYTQPIPVHTAFFVRKAMQVDPSQLQFEHYPDGTSPYPMAGGNDEIHAFHGDQHVGVLRMTSPASAKKFGETPGVISWVHVNPDYRGNSIGQHMLNHAQSLGYSPIHAPEDELTDDGAKFKAKNPQVPDYTYGKTAFFVRRAALADHTVTSLRNITPNIKALHAEMTRQGIPEDHPIRGAAFANGSHIAISRTPDGLISGAANYTLSRGSKQIDLNQLRALGSSNTDNDSHNGAGEAIIQHMAQQTAGLPNEHKYTMGVYGAVDSAKPFYAKMGANFSNPFSSQGSWDQTAMQALKAGQRPVPGKIAQHGDPIEGDQWGQRWGSVPEVRKVESEYDSGMLALIPSNTSGLHVEGGDPEEQLHMTMLYLGDNTDWPEEKRQKFLDAIDSMDPEAVEGKVIGVAELNKDQPDKKQCAVYLVSELPEEIDALRSNLTSDFELPEQHTPFLAHITAGFDLEPALLNYSGPVNFDTLRCVWGTDVYDFPLKKQTKTSFYVRKTDGR